MINLKQKNAFITGSSRGIGQQIAIGLAEQGCNIIVHGRTKENCLKTLEILKAYTIKTYCVYGELSSQDDINQIIKQVHDLHINVDILYNNAGVMTPYKVDYWKHSWEDMMLSMKVNVFSIYGLCSAFIPAMVENGFGRVINLVSGIKDQPELLPYSLSKWAIVKLTDDIAIKLDGTGVRINNLDPSWLTTDLGGEHADNPVEAVLPGALTPALIENDGANGETFFAIEEI
ncbi:MAG: 3-oxoacyl-[acyl-carrier protein] reductase [Candidatus Azotimanducaceae bacterium]|jgi:3-oxoacyl-[acyl-carrier protein] reductase